MAAVLPLLLCGLLAASANATAVRAGGVGCLTVHVGPQLKPGEAASYYKLTATPGTTTREAVLLANPEPYSCQVELDAAYGKTALNSGDTYPFVERGSCFRTSCWLSGLPGIVAVPAHTRLAVGFTVKVPAHTKPGEYLAGVLVRPYARVRQPAPRQHSGVAAIVMTSVGIGVAVRVPGPLHPQISIPAVTLVTGGGTPVLDIVEHDGGNTWEHPTGSAQIVTAPRAPLPRFAVNSSTILPGDSATLTLPLPGVSGGAHVTRIVFWYANHTRRVVWEGRLNYPTPAAPSAPRNPHLVIITTNQTPSWLIDVAAGLGAMLLLLAGAVLVLLRRRVRAPRPLPATPSVPAPALTFAQVIAWKGHDEPGGPPRS